MIFEIQTITNNKLNIGSQMDSLYLVSRNHPEAI